VYDPIHDRIASICAASTQLWKIKGRNLAPILSSPFECEGYGKCVQFCDNGASLVMYYLDTHEWYVGVFTCSPIGSSITVYAIR